MVWWIGSLFLLRDLDNFQQLMEPWIQLSTRKSCKRMPGHQLMSWNSFTLVMHQENDQEIDLKHTSRGLVKAWTLLSLSHCKGWHNQLLVLGGNYYYKWGKCAKRKTKSGRGQLLSQHCMCVYTARIQVDSWLESVPWVIIKAHWRFPHQCLGPQGAAGQPTQK